MNGPAILVGFIVLIAGCVGPPLDSEDRTIAPDLELETVSNRTWTLAEHEGEAVVLDFMDPTCKPCEEQMPTLEQVFENRTDRPPLAAVSIDVGSAVYPAGTNSSSEELERFRRSHDADWPFARDPRGSAMVDYRVVHIPTLVVVDPDGRIVERFTGAVEAVELEEAISEASR